MFKKLLLFLFLSFIVIFIININAPNYRYQLSNDSFSKFDWVNDFQEHFINGVHITKSKIDWVREVLFKTQNTYNQVKTWYEDVKTSYDQIKTSYDQAKQVIDSASWTINSTKDILNNINEVKKTFTNTWITN